jgi:hypothetical protein
VCNALFPLNGGRIIGSVKMNFKHSISLDIPYDVYEYIENNHGKLSYSGFIEKMIRERMTAKTCKLETDPLKSK